MTRTDRKIALLVLTLAIVGYGVFLLLPKAIGSEVSVQTGSQEALRLRLDTPATTRTVTGPVGESIIEVRDGQAHMLWSDCPDKVCMKMGWISRPGSTVICLPNQVVIRIEKAR